MRRKLKALNEKAVWINKKNNENSSTYLTKLSQCPSRNIKNTK